ncbi:MAG: T9SS type A sorting domain-containing protein [Phaeodactylibacter sp.]|nr:T9SS type A sorting domain-containing protein [Phaeodactylibacter sp.]
MKFLTPLITAILFLSFQAFGQINLQEGIVSAFPINGDADDESSNENDCNIPMGVTLTEDRFGVPDGALLFDGQSFLECGPPNALDDLALPVSFSCWYLIEAEHITEFLPVFYTDDNNGDFGNYYGFTMGFTGQKIWVGYGDGTGAFIHDRRGTLSDSLLIPDIWTNVIGTIDENMNSTIYINGVNAAGSQNGSSNLNVAHNLEYPLRFGTRSRYGPTFFKGKLDEIFFWDRLLTPDEIQEIVKGGLATSTVNIFESDLKVYPNPANDRILIAGLKNFTQRKVLVEVIDLYGRKILSRQLLPNEENGIELSRIAPGKYYISMKNNDILKTSLITIMRE